MLQEKSLPYQPGSHTVIRKHRTDQAETVTPSEAKSSHRSVEYCTICTFQIIKNVYDFKLTDKTRKLVDFYSDDEQVIPFVHQLERDLKSDNYV